IGSGPAGVSAALTLKSLDKNFIWLSSRAVSKKVSQAELIKSYPGLPDITGAELGWTFQNHYEGMNIKLTQEVVTGVYDTGEGFTLLAGNNQYEAKAVILCLGVQTVKPLEGEEEFVGRGVSYCATCDGMLYRGRRVAVLGWTPSAKKEAEFLESIGCEVLYFDKPRDCAVLGGEKVEAVRCGGVTEAVEGVFLLRPAMAPGDLFPGLAAEGGFVAVDRELRTNLPGVFAAGDCTGGPLQVSKAVGEGLVAGQKAAAFAAALK
ncbi:MAG: NAD(P)/FAD-dependent oxidoreductase, partial [Dysosmobacter sp.]|nr:NAD(P)/FAD-dependent oxidoreductase [Dysosmobacter sp.]